MVEEVSQHYSRSGHAAILPGMYGVHKTPGRGFRIPGMEDGGTDGKKMFGWPLSPIQISARRENKVETGSKYPPYPPKNRMKVPLKRDFLGDKGDGKGWKNRESGSNRWYAKVCWNLLEVEISGRTANKVQKGMCGTKTNKIVPKKETVLRTL